MITAIVIDDMQKNVLMMVRLLQQYCPQVIVIGTADSAAAAKKLVEDLRPQLLILDVEMPYGSGFDLLKSMPEMDAEIIFVTAYGQYALNAFRFAALDYLLKPVNIEELQSAVLRAKQRIKEKKATRSYELWLNNLDEKDINKQAVSFSENGQHNIVQLGDIMYIVADGSYTHIHTSKKIIVSSRSLKDFENMFPASQFCRIHHGHIVNKNYVTKIQKGRGGTVLMKDGRELEVSVRRKEDFRKMFQR